MEKATFLSSVAQGQGALYRTLTERGREGEGEDDLEDWAGRAATGMGKALNPAGWAQHLVAPGDTSGQIGNHHGPRKEK